MSNEGTPDVSLFLDILRTLERIGAPYMIIGGFAATMYGITRTTHNIGLVSNKAFRSLWHDVN